MRVAVQTVYEDDVDEWVGCRVYFGQTVLDNLFPSGRAHCSMPMTIRGKVIEARNRERRREAKPKQVC